MTSSPLHRIACANMQLNVLPTHRGTSPAPKESKGYEQWVELTLQNKSRDFTLRIADLDLLSGKLYSEGDMDAEIFPDDIFGTIIAPGQEYTIRSCGREKAESRCEGYITVFRADGGLVRRVYWGGFPSGSNDIRCEDPQPDWIVDTTKWHPQGPLGEMKVMFAYVGDQKPKKYARWAEFTVHNKTREQPLSICGVQLKWGRFYKEGDMDDELCARDVDATVAQGERSTLRVRARDNTSSWCEGHFGIYAGDTLVRTVYWIWHGDEDNVLRLDDAQPGWVVDTSAWSKQGALGEIDVRVAYVGV